MPVADEFSVDPLADEYTEPAAGAGMDLDAVDVVPTSSCDVTGGAQVIARHDPCGSAFDRSVAGKGGSACRVELVVKLGVPGRPVRPFE